jgi:3-oxoacyl-[acyl-carrier-protein] synthase II
VTSTVTAGHAAGAQSLTYAYELVRTDHADAVVSLATDTITDAVVQGYQDLGVLTKGEPGSNGQGFALAEGSVALVVERLSHAEARGAKPLAEVLGYAVTSDARGVGRIDTDGHGIEAAMRLALERAGLEASDIGTIWATACGLQAADEAEAKAIERVFGEGADVAKPKLLLGEPMGAGGSLNAALAIESWRSGGAEAKPALINSLSLGGTNFSIVLAPSAGG